MIAQHLSQFLRQQQALYYLERHSKIHLEKDKRVTVSLSEDKKVIIREKPIYHSYVRAIA
jgi:hypothetical protein